MRGPCVGAILVAFALACGAPPRSADPVGDWRERTGNDSLRITIEGAERMDPVQRVYGTWGRQVYSCLARYDYELRQPLGVRVFTADSIAKEGVSAYGIWLWPRTMVVREEDAATERVIKHELAHIYCPACPHPVVEHCARRR